MRTLKYAMIWTILIGTIAVGLNFIWTDTITFISTRYPTHDQTTFYYVYDFKSYLQNMQFAAAKTTFLSMEMPTREWKTGAWEVISLLDQIGNNLAVILDYGILAINILIFPFRIIAYIIQLLMSFIGFNMSNMDNNAFAWLKTLTEWFIERLQIPYI